MKRAVLSLLVLACALFVSCGGGGGGGEEDATPPSGKTFGGTGNDYGMSVLRKASGGFILAGTTNSFGAGDYDAYLVETDEDGNLVRETTFGRGGNDCALSVRQTGDGGFIVAGLYDAPDNGWITRGDWVPGDLPGVLFLRKVDASLGLTWEKEFTYSSANATAGYDVRQIAGGGYVVVGDVRNVGVWGYTYLIKTDADGNLLWESLLDGDIGTGVLQTPEGGFVTSSFEIGSFGPSWITRTDAAGFVVGTPSRFDDAFLYSLCAATGGGYAVTGESAGAFYLAKVDSSGGPLWENTLSGMGGLERGYSIQETSDGGLIAVGEGGAVNHQLDVKLVKTDASGNTQWTRVFGKFGNDMGRSVHEIPGGGFIVGGSTESFGAGGSDLYLIKTDASGAPLW